jgi:hypothetical protein
MEIVTLIGEIVKQILEFFGAFAPEQVYFPPLSRQKFGIFKVEDFFPPCVVSVMFFYPKNTC